jgi:hypothetical protein
LNICGIIVDLPEMGKELGRRKRKIRLKDFF